jgi:uncharacterized protein YqhQ
VLAKPYIGGQAVIEGVMMRSPKSFVVAVRRPDQSIAVREQQWTALLPVLGFLRWPLFRGAWVLLESLHNGFSALKFSAEYAVEVGEKEPARSGSSKVAVGLMLPIVTLAMVALFIAAPHLLTYGLGRLVGPALDTRGFLFHLVDGVVRLMLLLGYILLIARTSEAKRLFQYHGAEHKAIWTYESGLPLTVANARPFTTLHPRCGTSFLFVVVLVAVLVHVALIPFIPQLHPNPLVNQLLLVLIKVPVAFPIAGIAYELQRLSARGRCPALIRWLTRPGMWMQRITTREPTNQQLEIALVALERALAREQGRSKRPDGIAFYSSYSGALEAA